jgi:hypothetical protein
MDDQNNLNNSNQNPLNPMDSSTVAPNPKPVTQEIPDTNPQPSEEQKPIQEVKNDENISTFAAMDSSSFSNPVMPVVGETPEENLSNENETNLPNTDFSQTLANDMSSKKKPGGKLIATILGILMLLIGVGAGVVLLRQQQDIREKASEEYPSCTLPNGVTAPCQPCTKGGTFVDPKSGATLSCSVDANGNKVATTDDKGNVISCASGWYKCTVDDPGVYSVACCKVGTATNPPTSNPSSRPSSNPSPSTSPIPSPSTPPTMSCGEVKAYDTSWNLLTSTDLANLSEGEIIRLTISGGTTANQANYDKARFTINNVLKPETTNIKPSSSPKQFFIEYTIPANTTTFNVKAEIHHTTGGWIGL